MQHQPRRRPLPARRPRLPLRHHLLRPPGLHPHDGRTHRRAHPGAHHRRSHHAQPHQLPHRGGGRGQRPLLRDVPRRRRRAMRCRRVFIRSLHRRLRVALQRHRVEMVSLRHRRRVSRRTDLLLGHHLQRHGIEHHPPMGPQPHHRGTHPLPHQSRAHHRSQPQGLLLPVLLGRRSHLRRSLRHPLSVGTIDRLSLRRSLHRRTFELQ
mmetsp:Transcript_28258/g.56663  ORF Transcript_28258/g.56663 Transcript_28258/m.56663 type:complete len:208 (-) Transcript_28258:1160-1783(-)